MTDAGFFRGTSTEQDVRFSDKDKKLLKMMKFESCLEQKVDMHKVNFEALKPWVSEQVTLILGIDDEVVIELIFSFLENERYPNAKKLQILVTGFLQSKPARIFIGQLWDLLLSAQENPAKLPEKFIEEKKNAIRQQRNKIEMQLNMREDQRRSSPGKDRMPDIPRSPGSRGAREKRGREAGEMGLGVHVQKSEASSTQMDTEHGESRSLSFAALNKLKALETSREHPESLRDSETKGGDQREKIRSRSRSHSPSGRRQRSRSYERRYRQKPSPHRYRHSPNYSPDSHTQQRGRGHPRDSPRHPRPHRSPEERWYHERHTGTHKQTEHHDTVSQRQQPRPEYTERQHPPPRQPEIPSSATKLMPRSEAPPDSRRHQYPMPDEERYTKRRQAGNRSPDRAISPKQARQGHTAQRREESCSSSRSPLAEKKSRREEGVKSREPERKREYSASSSVSSESESSPSHDKHKRPLRSKHQSKVRPSKEPPPQSSKREIARESAKRGSGHSKHKHRQRRARSESESERSEHTSDNFSEIEARRKAATRARKLKVSKKRHRDKHSSSLRGKLKRASKRINTERSVVAKRKQRTRSLEVSEDSEHTEGEMRDRTKKKHRHISPVVVKKSRHKRTPPPPSPPADSNSDSSESESSSSDSNSDWSGDAKEKKRDKSSGKGRKKARVESSEVSSETEDSLDGERRRCSLEKHLREKVIQAMSKKKLKKNKN